MGQAMTLSQILIKIHLDNQIRRMTILMISLITMRDLNKASPKMSLLRCLAMISPCSPKPIQPIMEDLYLMRMTSSLHFLPKKKRRKMDSTKFSKPPPKVHKDKASAKLQKKLTPPTNLLLSTPRTTSLVVTLVPNQSRRKKSWIFSKSTSSTLTNTSLTSTSTLGRWRRKWQMPCGHSIRTISLRELLKTTWHFAKRSESIKGMNRLSLS